MRGFIFHSLIHFLYFHSLSLERFPLTSLYTLGKMSSSYVALMVEDPSILHAELDHHISRSARLEVNYLLVPEVFFAPLLVGMFDRKNPGE